MDKNKVNYLDTNLPQQKRAENIFGMFQTTRVIPTGRPKNFLDQVKVYSYDGGTRTGGYLVGTTYVIATVGTTDFTLIGAASNTVGLKFIATGIGSGTGTATPKNSRIYFYNDDMNQWYYWESATSQA